MKHEPRSSPIGKAICAELENQPEHDRDIDPCIVGEGGCFLSPGIEHIFVSLTAKAFVDYAWANQRLFPYQQLIYSPHSRVERPGGFDLSAGFVWQEHRLRMMHKLIYARQETDPWCDESWAWTSMECQGNASEHISNLVHAHQTRTFLQPFLVIHVCFCLHEYRRMGLSIGEVAIPGFADPRRTVAVDLSPLRDARDARANFKAKDYSVEVRYDAAADKRTAKLTGSENPIDLPVHPLSELLRRFLEITPAIA